METVITEIRKPVNRQSWHSWREGEQKAKETCGNHAECVGEMVPWGPREGRRTESASSRGRREGLRGGDSEIIRGREIVKLKDEGDVGFLFPFLDAYLLFESERDVGLLFRLLLCSWLTPVCDPTGDRTPSPGLRTTL